MISIIVCSINESYLHELKANVAASVGCEYELIAIDNRNTGKGICQVYNEAAKQAKYSILCFLHEDVGIHTNSWGYVLANLLSNIKVGLVGISGAIYKSKYPATWSACDKSLYRTHSIQHFQNEVQPIITNLNPDNKSFSEVAVLDGVFLATRKDVFDEFKFDESKFTGFHAYDLDYSLVVGAKYKIIVTYGILIEHFSEGTLSRTWLIDSFRLHKKWESFLPRTIGHVTEEMQRRSDYLACQAVVYHAILFEIDLTTVTKYYWKLISKFFCYNKLNFTKTYSRYLLRHIYK